MIINRVFLDFDYSGHLFYSLTKRNGLRCFLNNINENVVAPMREPEWEMDVAFQLCERE
jgi:hypothetical protein